MNEFKESISQIEDRVIKLEESKKPDISLNIVVKNLTLDEGENITDRVNGLLKDGMKL